MINESYQSENVQTHNTMKICDTLTEYIIKNPFKENDVKTFMEKLKQPRRKKVIFKKKSLKTDIQSYYQRHGCRKQITDYNNFNNKIKLKKDEMFFCDMIPPPLQLTSKICKSLGEYYLQFGVDFYLGFYKMLKSNKEKTLKQIIKEEKKENRNLNKKNKPYTTPNKLIIRIQKAWNKIYSIIVKMKKSKKLSPLVKLAINGYYKLNCKTIINDYKEFYVYYTKNKNKARTNVRFCDYFVHGQTNN